MCRVQEVAVWAGGCGCSQSPGSSYLVAHVWQVLQDGPHTVARVTPPSLASDAPRSFDEEVQRCFALCTAIEVPNRAWCQAQLGLKFGGLGLRSVSFHAAAAFIASLSSSGYGSADYIHLQQAVVAFNSQVSVPNAVSVISVLASPTPTQKVLSGMIENQLFSTLLPTELVSCQWQPLILPLGYQWSLHLVWACTSSPMSTEWP